jgi:hypothetical protein
MRAGIKELVLRFYARRVHALQLKIDQVMRSLVVFLNDYQVTI